MAGPHKIAVNLSAVQVTQLDLPRKVHEILLETGLSPGRLELELTESAIIVDKERTLHVLRQLKASGSRSLSTTSARDTLLSTLRAFRSTKSNWTAHLWARSSMTRRRRPSFVPC